MKAAPTATASGRATPASQLGRSLLTLGQREQWRTEPAREKLLLCEQLRVIGRQAHRVPGPVMLAAVVVAAIVLTAEAPQRPAIATVLGWVAALLAVVMARRQYCCRLAARVRRAMAETFAMLAVMSAVNGTVVALASALFFPVLGFERQMLLTMILVCWSAGAIPASGCSARMYLTYAVPILGSLVIAWPLAGRGTGFENAAVAGLICLFFLIQTLFVVDGERMFRESFQIRHVNERLVAELREQRQQVALERDRAYEANLAKSRFLAAASHDLRQPLHTVSIYSAALALRALDARTREIAQQIGQGIGALGTLLDGLLDISKLDAGAVQPQPVAIGVDGLLAALQTDFGPIAANRGLSLEVHAADALTVRTDRLLLERILRNLVDNAIKYTVEGGVRIQAHALGPLVEIEVSDSGIGIPADQLDKIFEEFYQVANPERDRASGLGLGLAIVRRLADLLRIELEVSSVPGVGSRFVLRLPRVSEAAPRPAAAPPPEGLPNLAGRCLLLVDDEASIRSGTSELLGALGVRVVTAGGIDEALAALRTEPIELLVADYRLRGSETGAALIRRARALRPRLPAIVVTGDVSADRLRDIEELQVPLLHKPVSAEHFQRTIAAALE